MSQLGAVVQAKLRMAGHQIASVRDESKLKVGVISLSAMLLWVGAFIMFYSALNWLHNFGGGGGNALNLGVLLVSRMLSIMTLAIFLLLIFSNVLISFSTMYRSKEVVYLLQGPITFELFFHARFLECVAFSSWSLAYLGSPLVLAQGMVSGAPMLFYLAALLFFVPFIIVPACLGSVIAMLLVRVFPRLRLPVLVVIGVASVGAFFLYIAKTIGATRIDENILLPAFLDATARAQSPLLPSHWAAQGLLAAAQRNYGESLYFFLLLVSTAMMGMLVGGKIAQVMFFPGWSYLAGQDRRRILPPGKRVLGRIDFFFRAVRNPERALVLKDIKLFWRDPTQWSQFVIFFGIMAIYIANLRNTSHYHAQEFGRSWIACLNVGALTLILSTLTSRFVYPLISLEGRRFWIIGLAPLELRQLLWQKFFLSVCCTSVFTVSLAMLSGYMLRLQPIYFFLTVYSVVITNFGLAGLAVGLGALYPSFSEDNPARIVSGLGGTLNLLLSVGYITLVVLAQVLMLQWRVLERFTGPGMFWIALACVLLFVTLLSLLCTWLPLRLGLRSLEASEY